ncbi:hypothetical protein D3C72_2392780 [compost metagenome]
MAVRQRGHRKAADADLRQRRYAGQRRNRFRCCGKGLRAMDQSAPEEAKRKSAGKGTTRKIGHDVFLLILAMREGPSTS